MATQSVDYSSPKRPGRSHRSRAAHPDSARFERLYELFARLAACNDLDSALQEVLYASIEVTGADAGYIRFFDFNEIDPISSPYPFVAHKGISDEYVEYFGSLAKPLSATYRQALFEGHRTFFEDMFTHPIFQPHREIVIAEGYRTLHGTPMMSRNGSKCVGVICTYFREIRSPSPTSLDTLDLFAEVAASTIDNYRHIAELARRERSWSEITQRQADVLRRTREHLANLEASAPRLQPQDVAERARSIASRIEQVKSEPGPTEANDASNDLVTGQGSYGLSQPELDVLMNVWFGLSDKESAAEMGLSRYTVAKYLASAMRKLNVDDRNQASILVGHDILSREGGLKLSFSDLLRQFRRRAGLTQAELAEKAGLSYRTISDLERGVRTKVYASTVGLISSALSLPEDDAASLAASVDRSRKSRLNGRDISPLSPK